MKTERIERLIRMVRGFLFSPSESVSLTEMAKQFGVSKTVISDDICIIDSSLAKEGIGRINVSKGRGGGAFLKPFLREDIRKMWLEEIAVLLEDQNRLLPGSLVYYSDILFNPQYVSRLGYILASDFSLAGADIVMTSEVKGIPLAIFTAFHLGLPLAVCRFRNRASDGPAVSVHYQAARGEIRTMFMGTRNLPRGSRVLIIDDFMRGGSTVSGMMAVAKEFGATPVGVGVFMVSAEPMEKAVDDYRALLRMNKEKDGTVKISVEKSL